MQSNSSEALANLQKVTTVTNYFLQPAMQGIISLMVGVFIVGALIYADPLLAMVSLGSFTAVYFLVAVPARVVLRRNSRVVARVQAERIQNVQEGVGGIRDVLLDRAQPIYLRRYAALDRDYRNAQSMTTFLGMMPRFMIEAAGMILIALLAFSFAKREGGLLAVLPMLGALAIGAQRLMPLLQQIYLAWVQMTGNQHDLVNILDFLDQPVARPPERIEPMPFHDRLEMRSLSFSYAEDASPAISDVSLTIPAGATIGFVGKTGSGKSTFLDLLMGLLEPRSGSIVVDGKELDELARWSWRANISHVPQAIYLIDGTIAENIAFGLERDEIDMDRVREAARLALIADHVESLPEQYNSFVGERGQRLSGGQRQRIGIARALYTGRPVLVLDEATSALDTGTETAIMDAIGALNGQRTVIIVAHRLSTLRQCSHVFRFDNGRVVEQGSYDDVIGSDDTVSISR
jgi:ATP-binding cassette subfamily B protein